MLESDGKVHLLHDEYQGRRRSVKVRMCVGGGSGTWHWVGRSTRLRRRMFGRHSPLWMSIISYHEVPAMSRTLSRIETLDSCTFRAEDV
jgi:hypothetical protein